MTANYCDHFRPILNLINIDNLFYFVDTHFCCFAFLSHFVHLTTDRKRLRRKQGLKWDQKWLGWCQEWGLNQELSDQEEVMTKPGLLGPARTCTGARNTKNTTQCYPCVLCVLGYFTLSNSILCSAYPPVLCPSMNCSVAVLSVAVCSVQQRLESVRPVFEGNGASWWSWHCSHKPAATKHKAVHRMKYTQHRQIHKNTSYNKTQHNATQKHNNQEAQSCPHCGTCQVEMPSSIQGSLPSCKHL